MPSAIFIFRHPITANLLVETRPEKDSYFPGQQVYPGGKTHRDEHPYDAMVREAEEELGVAVKTSFGLSFGLGGSADFRFVKPIYYHGNSPEFQVFPYLITRWEGVIPDHILDTGHPTNWITPTMARRLEAGCTTEITRRIDLLLENHTVDGHTGFITPTGLVQR